MGEALRLKQGDVDWNKGVIRIGEAKFLKSRLIPVHPTTLEKLRAYARKHEGTPGTDVTRDAVLLTETAQALGIHGDFLRG
jgi:integrase